MNVKYLEMAVNEYTEYLFSHEKSLHTVTQYRRDIFAFISWLGKQAEEDNFCAVPKTQAAQSTSRQTQGSLDPNTSEEVLNKQKVILWKNSLCKSYKPASVNVKLAAVNGFFGFLNRDDLKVRQLKIQKSSFCSKEKELSKEEYFSLVRAAEKKGDERLSLILQTICATGIRVSELCFITKQAALSGKATITLKGKTRTILIQKKLCKKLLVYIRKENIPNGSIFLGKNGRPLNRTSIWKMMKGLCEAAHVSSNKVFPHNLRHLFARCFYSLEKDIVKLADVLGHSSINTTRIYTLSSGTEHKKQLDLLNLII